MNNKGQVLVLFVVLLPVIFLLAYFVYDNLSLYYEKRKLNNISLNACNYIKKEKDINKIKYFILENDNKLNIKIEIENNNYTIKLDKEIENLIGKKNKIKVVTMCK